MGGRAGLLHPIPAAAVSARAASTYFARASVLSDENRRKVQDEKTAAQQVASKAMRLLYKFSTQLGAAAQEAQRLGCSAAASKALQAQSSLSAAADAIEEVLLGPESENNVLLQGACRAVVQALQQTLKRRITLGDVTSGVMADVVAEVERIRELAERSDLLSTRMRTAVKVMAVAMRCTAVYLSMNRLKLPLFKKRDTGTAETDVEADAQKTFADSSAWSMAMVSDGSELLYRTATHPNSYEFKLEAKESRAISKIFAAHTNRAECLTIWSENTKDVLPAVDKIFDVWVKESWSEANSKGLMPPGSLLGAELQETMLDLLPAVATVQTVMQKCVKMKTGVSNDTMAMLSHICSNVVSWMAQVSPSEVIGRYAKAGLKVDEALGKELTVMMTSALESRIHSLESALDKSVIAHMQSLIAQCIQRDIIKTDTLSAAQRSFMEGSLQLQQPLAGFAAEALRGGTAGASSSSSPGVATPVPEADEGVMAGKREPVMNMPQLIDKLRNLDVKQQAKPAA